jgi:hypothetical protein
VPLILGLTAQDFKVFISMQQQIPRFFFQLSSCIVILQANVTRQTSVMPLYSWIQSAYDSVLSTRVKESSTALINFRRTLSPNHIGNAEF